ncbi:alcohol dehydrogenase catalytic domain-containing protein [Nocardioides convexus]|uniref:alcohol dehydrogenase catalytic domain-containing protein n=1 Tax=Nocardioides convexus TaxID=2712224 RepID=UPI002418A583|nr:alcohol dehydrogenase catalytic domain-containing protein [Nocardioides convexus]
MKAVTWQGKGTMSVEEVPDPTIQRPDDIVVRVTSTGLCGSDLHLYDPLAPYMEEGDVVGHEPIGIVEEVGRGVSTLRAGDRVVVPFNLSLRQAAGCARADCTASARPPRTASTAPAPACSATARLYGQVPGAQAEYLRVPFADTLPIKVPEGPSDDRFVFLSDVLPTAWQAVEYAALRPGDTVLVLGAGPIGDMAARIAIHRGHRVLVVDPVPERRARVASYGAEVIPLDDDALLQVQQPPRAAARTRSSTRSAWRRTARRSRRAWPRWSACCRTGCPSRSCARPVWTGWPHCTWRSTRCVAAASSPSSGSTAERWTRCR